MMIYVYLFIAMLFSSTIYGETFRVDKVNIKCMNSFTCEGLEKTFKSLERDFASEKDFRDVIRLFVVSEGFDQFSYELHKVKNSKVLSISVKQKRTISYIDISFKDSRIELPSILPIKEGDFLDDSQMKATLALIKELAASKGYNKAKVSVEKKIEQDKVELDFSINLGQPIVLEKLVLSSPSQFVTSILEENLLEYESAPFDLQKIKNNIEDLRRIYLQYGFYIIDFDLKYKYVSKQKVHMVVNAKNTDNYNFFFQGIAGIEADGLKKYLSSSLISSKRAFTIRNVQKLIEQYLKVDGYFSPIVRISEKKDNSFKLINENHYIISIKKGKRSFVDEVVFSGNVFFSSKELMDIYYEHSTDLAFSNFQDEIFINNFRDIIRKAYIEQGYVNVVVEKPAIYTTDRKNTINFKLREGERAYIDTIKLIGVPEHLKSFIYKKLEIKEKQPFNPLFLKSDLKRIIKELNEIGYFYAHFKNLKSDELIKYKNDNTSVEIAFDFYLGPKVTTGEIIIIGNHKTQSRLIKREIFLSKDRILKSSDITQSRTNLLGLGLFSSVRIEPISKDKKRSDILVFVKEKDFGSIEVAPGIRNDIGFKLSSLITYNNIDGMNKRLTFGGSLSRRYDLSTLHADRQDTSDSLFEYDLDLNYEENHIFRSDYDFEAALSQSRKRLYSYDADLNESSFTMSRDFTSWFNASLKQQLLVASQYEAVDEKNHGTFQIGSLTPSVTFDFRNNKVKPTKGTFFNISCEFANPTFLSQSDDDLVINYYKLISRNRFYYPMSDRTVLAVSTAFGVQENLATAKSASGASEGFIPPIKVFKLSGTDIVRGFTDKEMNRIEATNDHISTYTVDEKAFMTNIKIEPRYYINDSMIIGAFYDAGRIFVDEFDGSKLRSSVGLTFKYLTPVGSLDFDYGIKLLRKRDSDGKLDSPGRLHVSIGFF